MESVKMWFECYDICCWWEPGKNQDGDIEIREKFKRKTTKGSDTKIAEDGLGKS